MRESIICVGRTGKKPYRFPETGVQIFSYEELCYYLSGHMLLYLCCRRRSFCFTSVMSWALRSCTGSFRN